MQETVVQDRFSVAVNALTQKQATLTAVDATKHAPGGKYALEVHANVPPDKPIVAADVSTPKRTKTIAVDVGKDAQTSAFGAYASNPADSRFSL